jgi:hypothetical protein
MLELSLEDTVFADPNPTLMCDSKAIIKGFSSIITLNVPVIYMARYVGYPVITLMGRNSFQGPE